MLRGKEGEAAIVRLNGRQTGMSASLEQNSKIDIIPSTRGADAVFEISSLPEYSSSMDIIFNGKEITCPRFVTVNGELVSGFYEVKDLDRIEILGYYTLEQVLEFMDIIYRGKVYVNNVIAPMDTKVYDNFSIICEIMKEEPNYNELIEKYGDGQFPVASELLYSGSPMPAERDVQETIKEDIQENIQEQEEEMAEEDIYIEETQEEEYQEEEIPEEKAANITVNGDKVVLTGKQRYILVDVLDFYPVDTSVAHGDHLETSVNGIACDFTQAVNDGDIIKIEWVERQHGG